MVYAVCTDFVSLLNHALEQLDVSLIPIGLAPIGVRVPIYEYRVCICNQEKRGGQAVLIENGKSLFKLASQSIVKG